jgi:hypothetical protein
MSNSSHLAVLFSCVVLSPELPTSLQFILIQPHYLPEPVMGSAAGTGKAFLDADKY